MTSVERPRLVARSPYEMVGGLTFLPRTIDKMRARIAGTAPEYKHNAGLSQQLCELFGLTADQFQEVVAASETDEQVLHTLLARRPLSQSEIEEWNHRARTRAPSSEKGKAKHRQQLEQAGFGHRTDVVTMFDRVDLEDGREVPLRS
jgi:hypothetical protein